MKKLLLSFAALALFLTAQAQQVQNPGFESWTSGSNVFPLNWGSFSQMVVALGQPNPMLEVQSTVKHTGMFAILLQTQNVALAGGNVQGEICTGPLTLVGGNKVTRGFQAFTGQPQSYDFWYEFNAIGGDTASTVILLTKWNTVAHKRDTLAVGGSNIVGAQASYTHMAVSINWLTVGVPDSIQLVFQSSIKHGGQTVPTGGKLYLDDINMSLSNGIASLEADHSFSAFPNPASTSLTVSSTNAHFLTVYDLTGRALNTYAFFNKMVQADVNTYANGIYSYAVMDQNKQLLHRGKFVVTK
jgi:hypothetical protein